MARLAGEPGALIEQFARPRAVRVIVVAVRLVLYRVLLVLAGQVHDCPHQRGKDLDGQT